ncbi:hypothetical protein BELL_0060g00200 [Botrytis elliptica]|uniref:Uncharacterized protein n=1 Tax=Botrytis elliptica TaxID=278938 RepID=A0A4Z1JZ26_9HELO|nr:hypothetical protein EAE99_001283 [Botrytis elliptica]TGO78626.1 hypothetical protein BELL_0060g00200 [Botrytis elliptica]
MSTTKLIPSRPLLRYLNEKISSTSVRPFSHPVNQQSSTNSLRRSILLRLPQQCRHIMLSRIAERTKHGKLQADNHKILDYVKTSLFSQTDYQSQKIILWAEADKKPYSKPHTFIGVMTIGDAMKDYLCKREEALLDPGEGTSWMLVPRTGFQNISRGERHQLKKIAERLHDLGATDVDEYILIKRKSFMVPKPGKAMKTKGGRGNAKLINLTKDVTGDNLSVMLAKAYYFLETRNYNAEFHIHFAKNLKFGENEMFQKMMEMPGGLALHPQVIQSQLPSSSRINIKPWSNGRELVWVVGRNSSRQQEKLVLLARDNLAQMKGTHEFVIHRGKEMKKDRNWRLNQDKREIETLKKEGKSFDHVLERQEEINAREGGLKSMFTEVKLARRQKEKDRKARRIKERLSYQARGRAMLAGRLERKRTLRTRWERRKQNLRATESQRKERDAMRASFLARRKAMKAELKAEAMIGTVNYYSRSVQIGEKGVEHNGSGARKIRLIKFKETARDVAKRKSLSRSPHPAAPTALRIERQRSLSQRRAIKVKARRELELRRKRASPIRSKFEDMI